MDKMAGIGRGDMGLNKQSRQVPTSTSHALRDVRQSLKQLQVSGLATPGDQFVANNDPQNWNTSYSHQDKRYTKHAKALLEIKNSLQNYEVGGDVDKTLLDQCVAWGYDEDVARETLKANRDKDFSVVLAVLNSLTEVSGRKFIKTIAPGSLQYARANPSTSIASSTSNAMRAAARPDQSCLSAQNSKLYGIPQPSNRNQTSSVTQNVNNIYLKGPPLAPTRLPGINPFIRKQSHDVNKPGVGGNDPVRVDRTQQFNLGERKISDSTVSNYPEVRLRQNRPGSRDAQKRWSADVLQKVKAYELENKRNSLAFEVGGDKRSVFDVPNKPPPPYPGPSPTEARHDPWGYGGSKFMPKSGNMIKMASMENIAKIGVDPMRMHGAVNDFRKQYVTQEHIEHQNVSAPKNQELPIYANKNVAKQMSFRDPPPYHALPHRPIQRTYSPDERTTMVQGTKPYSAVPSQPSYSQANCVQPWIPNENLMNSFVPIKQTRTGDNNYTYVPDENVSSHGSPPPYHSLEQMTSNEEKRLSINSDVESSTSSKRASMVFNDDIIPQSDSSGSSSPTAEKIESRCSPLPMTSSPYHTLIIRDNDINEETNVTEATKQNSEPFNSRLKSCSTQAFKFYMEQHVENVLKSQCLREKRKKQLETEMEKAGLSGKTETQIRKMLLQKETNYIRMKRSKMSRSLFAKVKTLGMGAFGEVALVRKIGSKALYAMKTLRKADVLKRNQVAHVKAERDILAEADNEWVVKLYYSFQDVSNLYFVMEYVPGGDLMALLIKMGIFSHELARFYTAELVLAVESVHKLGFIHRDIKPDNVLIDRNGHIKLTDFGLCTGFRWTHDSKYYQQDPTHARQPSMEPEGGWEKMLTDGPCDCGDILKKFDFCKPLDRRAARQHMRCLAHSLVGTPNYIAPEVLLRIPYTQLCDWWSVGVILYEMLVGQPPFLAKSPAETQMKVIYWQNTLRIPKQAKLSQDAENLIINLCVNPERRLGKHGTDEIKKHPFFNDVNWSGCLKDDVAPYIPKIRHATDTSNFDPVPEKDTSEDLDNAIDEEKRQIIEQGPQHAFYEFTFRRFFDEGGHPQELTLDNDGLLFNNDNDNDNEQPSCKMVTQNNNKRTATQSDKSITVPNKVAAPPIQSMKHDEKAPVYV